MRLATAAQMREIDRRTIEELHIPGLIVMENAAVRVVETIVGMFPHGPPGRVDVVCGPGNNGGDGLAIARGLAARAGTHVVVWLVGDPAAYFGDAAANYLMAQAYPIALRPSSEMDLSAADLIVDAVFGTGFHGPATGEAARVIDAINASDKPVISVDIPSGLDADTGKVEGPVVKATLTVTFEIPKFGMLDYPGNTFVGTLKTVSIGIPKSVIDSAPIHTFTTEAGEVARWLPRRLNGRDTNKGSFGHVLILAGSAKYAGAPVLVAEGAARSGAGLVTLAVPDGVHSAVQARVSPVVMTCGLPAGLEGSFGRESLARARVLAEHATVAVLGPGMGSDEGAAAFVCEFVALCPLPLVIDADALNLIALTPDRGRSLIRGRSAPTVLTPHPAEMGRLLGQTTSQVQSDRRAAIYQACEAYGCVTLLKGARTLIASADRTLFMNLSGNSGMATGGTGDVLSGVIGALLAQGLEPLPAAAAGVFVHGLAGDLAAAALGGSTGLLATDVIDHLPRAIARCQS